MILTTAQAEYVGLTGVCATEIWKSEHGIGTAEQEQHICDTAVCRKYNSAKREERPRVNMKMPLYVYKDTEYKTSWCNKNEEI